METAMTFFIGLLAGFFIRESIIKIKIESSEPKTGGIYQTIRPPVPKSCRRVQKPYGMTAAERADGYIRLASLADGRPQGKEEINQKQRLLKKAEATIDAAGERFRPTPEI